MTTNLTADAITIYRQSILIWENTPEDAFALTASYFGPAEAAAARDAYKANPALQRLADDE